MYKFKIEFNIYELREILEWCEGVEPSDQPWKPEEIKLYQRLSELYKYHRAKEVIHSNTEEW